MKEITLPGDECQKFRYVHFNDYYWNFVMFRGSSFYSTLSDMNNQLKNEYEHFNFAMIERLPESIIIRSRPSEVDRYISRILNLPHEARYRGLSKLKD